MSEFDEDDGYAAGLEAVAERVRARGSAASGRVRVEVAADGRITAVHIAEELRGHDATVLARLITEAHGAALAVVTGGGHRGGGSGECPAAGRVAAGQNGVRDHSDRNSARRHRRP
jgi:hypothetical protein